MNTKKKLVMGIDWGTSRTYPAILDSEGVCQSLLPSGNHLCSGGIPSLFAYNKQEGKILCDDVLAEELEIYAPEQVVSSIKMNLEKCYHLGEKSFSGEDIASDIIKAQMQYAKNELELQDLEAEEKELVICAPVSFGTTERMIIRNAFEKAGYQVVRIIPEPVAAAIYYGRKGHVLVVDLGAGTTDAAIVRENPMITSQSPYPYLYVDSSGIPVAGDMFDKKIADYLVERFAAEVKGIDITALRNSQSPAYRRMLVAARKAKEALSNKQEIGVTYNGREAGSGRVRLTREEMNRAIHPLVQEIMVCVKNLLARNPRVSEKNLEIIMTGGSSYIPYIREQLAKTCGNIPRDRVCVRAPEKAIGFGAAIFASNMDIVRPRVDFSYGVDTFINDEEKIQTLIMAGTELPYTIEKNYYTRHDDQTKVSFRLYEYRSREAVLPIDKSKQMKVSDTVHEFYKAVPKGTPCTAKMTLTEDGILTLQVTSMHSDHIGKTKCSIFTDSNSKK